MAMDIKKLVGEAVTHNLSSLGTGMIVDAYEADRHIYIKVFFPAAGKEMIFVFPDIFIDNKLLSSESIIVNVALEESAPKPAEKPEVSIAPPQPVRKQRAN